MGLISGEGGGGLKPGFYDTMTTRKSVEKAEKAKCKKNKMQLFKQHLHLESDTLMAI